MADVSDTVVDAPALTLRDDGRRLVGLWMVLRPRLTRPNALVAFLIYLALGLIWNRASVAHLNSVCNCGLPGDPAEFAWSFDWFPHALLHGLNPLYSRAMWTPTGINLAGTTAGPFLAYLLAPVTGLWSAVVSYNVATILAPVTASWSAFLLCRYITKSPWAAILVGVSYGFSTYQAAELGGHLVLGVIFCPPLVALCVLKALDGVLSKRRTVIELAVLLLVQEFISTEVLTTMTVVGALCLLFAFCFASKEGRSRILAVLPLIVAAYGIMLVLSSWYVYELLKAPAYAKNVGFYGYPTDLLSFFTPNPPTWLGGQSFASVTGLYIGGTGETLSYVGLPMILIALHFTFTRWSTRAAKILAGTLVMTILWILGGHLVVAGRWTIWLPYSLIGRLPVFNEVMQGRVALELSLLCAVVLAMWLVRPGRRTVVRWCLAVLAVACVVPDFLVHAGFVWTNPTFFRTNMYKHYLRPGETIMPITWGGFSESPMWQGEDNFYWNMANGYFVYPPPAGWNNKLTADLWADVPTAGDGALLRQFVIQRHVSDVVVQQSELQKWAPTIRQSGLRATATVGGVTIYHVPASWLGHAAA
ncbi:MAG TPA: hypothetical protein VHV75_06905 [Solirubrobacteraceae bacterium]|nr:hypothetical protein [Solirubrobacteraceae bacterium]